MSQDSRKPYRGSWIESRRASRGNGAKASGQGLIMGCSVNVRDLSCLRPLEKVLALNAGHRFHPPDGRRFASTDLGMALLPNFPIAYLAQLQEPFRHGRPS
jgi:hypothetical protein